jgi:hypothetical protein
MSGCHPGSPQLGGILSVATLAFAGPGLDGLGPLLQPVQDKRPPGENKYSKLLRVGWNVRIEMVMGHSLEERAFRAL